MSNVSLNLQLGGPRGPGDWFPPYEGFPPVSHTHLHDEVYNKICCCSCCILLHTYTIAINLRRTDTVSLSKASVSVTDNLPYHNEKVKFM